MRAAPAAAAGYVESGQPQGGHSRRRRRTDPIAAARRRRTQPRRRPAGRLLLLRSACTSIRCFSGKGADLFCQVPISYAQAALGATIEVPTLDGRESLAIPAGTQSGDVFTLKGRGMPDPRSHGRGNLLVQVHIDVPKSLTAEHEALLRRLAEIENAQVSPAAQELFREIERTVLHRIQRSECQT